MTTERLYSTTEAGKLLGGLHPNDVLLLVRSGKLRGKSRVVRGAGKHPRIFVPASEIERYIRELPDAEPKVEDSADAEPTRRRRRLPRGLAAELAAAKKYV